MGRSVGEQPTGWCGSRRTFLWTSFLATNRIGARAAFGDRSSGPGILKGDVYRSFQIAGKQRYHEATVDIDEAETAWYVVRCYGSNPQQIAITNPIYFASAEYQPPPPANAVVEIRVEKAGSGLPLNCGYEVIEMVGKEPKVLSTGTVRGGRASFTAPAISRIRVIAEGYRPEMRSIFVDTPELLNLTTEIQLSQLLDWATYEEIRRTLTRIRLNFEMRIMG